MSHYDNFIKPRILHLAKLLLHVTYSSLSGTWIAILSEGEEISRVAFIQSGSCIALVRVPRAPRFTQVSSCGNRNMLHNCTVLFPMQVMVGHLETGDCIGEGMLRGNDRQPYTIVSTTKLRVGWVTTTTLRGEGKGK